MADIICALCAISRLRSFVEFLDHDVGPLDRWTSEVIKCHSNSNRNRLLVYVQLKKVAVAMHCNLKATSRFGLFLAKFVLQCA